MKPKLTSEERDRLVLDLCEKVLEIEQRLIPMGKHVFGKVPASVELASLLRAVAGFDRPELKIRSLPDVICEALDLPSYPELVRQSRSHPDRMAQRLRVESLLEESIDCLLAAQANAAATASQWLSRTASVPSESVLPVFELLHRIRIQLMSNSELDSLARALRGEYLLPGPGADIVQNPAILPTGRNTHAINPTAIPSELAMRRAQPLTDSLIQRHLEASGRYPRSIAMVLWGIDNIKKEGEAVAQVLWLLGVKPRRDSLNRVTDVEVIPLDRLGRPRIDVVMTVSGIFRDLFPPTMALLDRAVRQVAALPEPEELNFVRRHVSRRMSEASCTFDEAAVRVFSNAAGNYGTNVNFMVLDSQWEESHELGRLFLKRKCFAYGRDSQGRSFEGREARRLLERALGEVEVTYQNIDSTEVGIVDVDHYFEYLGGLTKAAEAAAGARPAVYLADSLSPSARVRTLEETVRLEARTKMLNPKWYEAMLRHGFSGVAEIEHQLTNTFGWSATAAAVDNWIYDAAAETFVMDDEMLRRLRSLNPHSVHALVNRLLEASGRGLWSARPEIQEKLQETVAGLEDMLEGVSA
ncbi:MAG: cobaltochelatase subunit CobN [Acidobacteriota bacterium]